MKLFIVSIVVTLVALASAHPPHGDAGWKKLEHENLDADSLESVKLESEKLESKKLESTMLDSEKLDREKPIIEKSESESESKVSEFEKLRVKIYYEALCPDSRAMIADLGREYHVFKKHLTLEFVPFGRAQSTAEGKEVNFTCHHGPKECAGNRIQSCGLKYLRNQDAQQQFVVCQMEPANENPTGEKCLEEAGGDWSKVNDCIDGLEGIKLQLEAEAETKEISKPRLKNVPTVVFNDEYDQELQDKAVKGLKGVFCELLAIQKLSECA